MRLQEEVSRSNTIRSIVYAADLFAGTAVFICISFHSLERNGIGNGGLTAIGETLRHNKTLTSLE